jgi:hypothetical protein
MADIPGYFEEASAVVEANERYTATESYQTGLIAKFRKYHHWYAPANDDHWPEDAARRPGKLHITTNIVKRAVNIEARLQAKLPRLVLVPSDLSEEERARAELAEKLMVEYLEASEWKDWMHTLCRTKSIYGKGILKVSWDKEDRRPDVMVVENPGNLRIGWGSSDFRVMDWALYEYSLSPQEIMRRWPDVMVVPSPGDEPLVIMPKQIGSHDDPLAQNRTTPDPTLNYSPSDYEKKQVKVWDYWYKRGKDVYNCVLLQQRYHAVPPTKHAYLPDIPYIPIENDHEPGSPEGMSSVAPLIDLQIEMNREMSHWAQLINDETDPAWWVNKDSVPGGLVPKAGQMTPIGDDAQVGAFEKPVTTFPIEQLHGAFWEQIYLTSGLPPISWGTQGGSQVSGRALAVQVEAAINHIDPMRDILYGGRGLKRVLNFWTYMIEKLDPKMSIGPDGNKIGIAKFVKGFRRWQFVAPEITPRDVAEHTTNTINKVNAGLMSQKNAMDEIGIDSPQDELKLISEERSNIGINPGFVQQQIAVWAAIQQLQIQQEQLAQMAGIQGSSETALQAGQDQTGANNVKAQQQRAQPTVTEAENQGGLPATGQGGVPPVGIDQTTLVRANPQGQGSTLNQLAIQRAL